VITLRDLKNHLRQNVDEVEFLELLDITTEELTDAFDDKIADRFDFLVSKLELEEDGNSIPDDSDTDN
jgi:hypothetical protein